MRATAHPAEGVTPGSSEVIAWRLEQLRSHGFGDPLAEALARDCRFDLHRLIELVERGCPPHLAAEILAPTSDEPRSC